MEQPTSHQIANLETRYFKADFIEKHGATFVSWRRLDRALARFRKNILDGIALGYAPILKEFVGRFGANEKRIAALEKAIEELRANGPNLASAYKGSWMLGAFHRGDLVTMSGSLWLALADTEEKPGAGACWKLVVKRGADGKDLR